MRQFFWAMVLSVALAGAAHAQSLEAMAGQMVIVGFQGDTVDDAGVQAVRDQIAAGQIGGVMYLRTNVASLSRVGAMNAALNEAGGAVRPFITIDQEGGQVERLTRAVGFAETPSAARVAARNDAAQAQALYARMASGLAQAGFSVNFGPVIDLNLNPDNPVIARFGRSYGADPERVAAFGAAFVRAHRAAGVATALKHFPGHGSSRGDSHEGFVEVSDVWSQSELAPYRTLIGEGLADMVMAAHIYNANYDPEGNGLPASLSPRWIEHVLRDELGYEGVVISDDMEMGAVRSRYAWRDAIVQAVSAGNDILLFSNTADYDPALGARIQAILVETARENPGFRARIEQSYERIMALKRRLGLAS